jgi:hypothetical protein
MKKEQRSRKILKRIARINKLAEIEDNKRENAHRENLLEIHRENMREIDRESLCIKARISFLGKVRAGVFLIGVFLVAWLLVYLLVAGYLNLE